VTVFVTAALASCAGEGDPQATEKPPATDGVVRVGLYGGGWGDAVAATAGKKFEEETGARVEYVYGNPSDIAAQIYAARAQGAPPPVDIIQSGSQIREQLAGVGALVPLSEYQLDPDEVFGEIMQTHTGDYSPGSCDWHLMLTYNAEAFDDAGLDAPDSWEDLFAPELAGRVSIPSIATDMGLPTAVAYAGPAGDLSAGIAKLGTLQVHSVYDSTSDVLTDLGAGNVWVAALSEGGAWRLVDEDDRFTAVLAEVEGTGKTGPLGGQCLNDIVEGSENQELAEQFLRATYNPQVQVEFAKLAGYAPSDPVAKELLVTEEPSWADRIPNSDDVLTIDWPRYVPDLQSYVDEFNATVNR